MLRLENVSKSFRTGKVDKRVLQEVSLEVPAGQFLAVMGPSGCGKSTLLNIMGLLDSPDAGRCWFMGEDVSSVPEKRLTQLRRDVVGFIFQNFNLIEDLNVRENIEAALIYHPMKGAERKRRTEAVLERLGIADLAKQLPQSLSGGQQQRVAIARALAGDPKLVLADEPTGNLDQAGGEAVMALLEGMVKEGITVVMATHSLSHAARAHAVVKLLDGRIVEETLAGV
jgi:putative ABC transport system ATP-binding protein